MRVNQQCWDFLLCSRVTLCTNTYWFELKTLLLWVGIEPVLRKNCDKKELLKMSPCRFAWPGLRAQICAQVFARQKIIPALVWLFLSSSVSVRTTDNPKPQTNLQEVIYETQLGNKNNTTKLKNIPQASKFYTGFVAILIFFCNWFALVCNASQPTVLRFFVMQ